MTKEEREKILKEVSHDPVSGWYGLDVWLAAHKEQDHKIEGLVFWGKIKEVFCFTCDCKAMFFPSIRLC